MPTDIVVSEGQEKTGKSIQQNTADALARLEGGQAIFKAKVTMLAACRAAAISATKPGDWVLFRDKQGNVTGMICGEGAVKVAPFYGIRCENFRPINDAGLFHPIEEVSADGDEVSYTGACDAWCEFVNLPAEELTLTRSTREHFRGREGDGKLIEKGDMRSAIRTGLLTKAVRKLAGLQNVPAEELAQAWGSERALDGCRKGSGFGTSTNRTATRVAEKGVPEAAAELWEELVRRTGSEAAAHDLCKDVSKGYQTHPIQMTEMWKINQAWKNLREHGVFGDQRAQKGGENGNI